MVMVPFLFKPGLFYRTRDSISSIVIYEDKVSCLNRIYFVIHYTTKRKNIAHLTTSIADLNLFGPFGKF